jgi:hypothetical protein
LVNNKARARAEQRGRQQGNIGVSAIELAHKAAVMAHSRSMMPDLVGTSNIYGE